ncbi:kinase-like protein [Neolentinus lepideus HHB14362 ss-1]|uniref:Kinase-like protein n=1 Tax=Neolentinus lepideus HHB14362 ss-1 TaxID=1314782 RepID=A0A165PAH9_9AGAM|nr:kinase-like protein [Neolentinus lepideus HHB14362 ss-1]
MAGAHSRSLKDAIDRDLREPRGEPMLVGLGLAAPMMRAVGSLTAQFAPFPWLQPLAGAFGEIIQLAQNVVSNKRAAHQLCIRCQYLIVALQNAIPATLPPAMQGAVMEAQNVLEQIRDKMRGWSRLGKLQSFLMQGEIATDIQFCNIAISDCCDKFEITSQLATHEWQTEFKDNTKLDHMEVMEWLAEISHGQAIMNDQLTQNTQLLQQLAFMMQSGLADYQVGDVRHNGLQSNLYQITAKKGGLLPELELRRGEVRRLGQFPTGGSAAMDIWEGLYLGHEKVALKVVRAVNAGPKSQERFLREIKLWNEVWKNDGGKYILPFYGFCQIDGPFPYMVSPWQPNGVAIDYVRRNPDADHMLLVKGIAMGLLVLHTMDPPIVHGDIKGTNVVIDAMGNPLLADFGVSKIVEDITGVPFTQSRGVSESYRWFAPELCIGAGIMSLQADVYAYGMTVLELLTHTQPFAYIKHTTEVVVEVARGNRPRRPTEAEVVQRGLEDNLWKIMCDCWAPERIDRPSIQDIIERLGA